MGKRGGPSSTTIRDSERASQLGRLGAAALHDKKAAERSATQAAAAAAANPPPKPPAPVSPYVTPQSVTTAAQAAATAAAARSFPPACRVEIERLVPSWPGCRGYLETVDTDTIRAYGLKEYLRHNWGGERFKVTVVDVEGVALWSASDVCVAGSPKYYGAEIEAPRSIASPMSPAAYYPPTSPNPTAPPPPAPAAAATATTSAGQQLTRDERVELVSLVRQLMGTNERLLAELDKARGSTPGAVSPSSPDIGSVFRQARATLDAAREFSDEVQAVAGPPPAAPEPEDRHSIVSKEFMRGAARKLGQLLFDDDRKERQAAGPREPPPSSSGDFSDGGGSVVDGEVLH